MTFGQYLRFKRKLIVNQLTALTDLDPRHLVDFETGHDIPTLEDIARLAIALNVPQEGLMEMARHVRPGAV